MYYSDEIIRPQRYFPNVRSNDFVKVCTNYLIAEIIGSAPVEVILCRGTEGKSIQKKGSGLYLVGIPNGIPLAETELFYWFVAMCIVRHELHGCLFSHELFGETSSEDIKAFGTAFCQIGNEIISRNKMRTEELQQVLFLACPKKGIRIELSLLVNTP